MGLFHSVAQGVKVVMSALTPATRDADVGRKRSTKPSAKQQPLTPSEQELDKLERSLVVWERMIRFMAFPFICLSAWLTTKGLFDAKIEAHAANTEGMITAAMAAIMIGGATMLLFGLATHATKAQRGKLIFLTMALVPFVGAISTYNAILATSLEKSIILALRDRTVAWEEYMHSSMQDAVSASAAEKSLLTWQTSICMQAEGDRTSGVLTGSRGVGATYNAYASACAGVTSILTTLRHTAVVTEGRHDEGTKILAEMDSIPRNTAITVFTRQEQFKDQDRLMHKLLEDSSAERVADSVMAQLSAMEHSVASAGAHNGVFGRRQHQAITNLKQMIAEVSKTVKQLVNTDNTSVVLPPEQMLTVDEAMARYWRSNLSTIVIAIATDTFSLWLISFLFVARSMVQSKREALEASQTQHITQN